VDGVASALPPAEARCLTKLLPLTLVALAVGVAGGWVLFERIYDDDEASISGWNTCSNAAVGFSVSYPPEWHTDHPRRSVACMFFDPRPFKLAGHGNWGPTALQVIARSDELAPGHYERTTNLGLREYGYVVEKAGRKFSIFTSSNQGVDNSSWKRIVDQAADSFVVHERRAGPTLGAEVIPPQENLPGPVARKRAQIWAAARAEDHDAVARLADPAGFNYSFGGPVAGGPAAYWRSLERKTAEGPLETLAAILELPHVYQEESRLYVWPDAFARTAASLTIEEKEALANAIGVEGLETYEQLRNYLGYRAGIDAEGNWVFYVAGD
jgi:hypothetical protein